MKFYTSNKLSCVAAADFLNILQVICQSNLKPFFNSSVLFIGIKYIVHSAMCSCENKVSDNRSAHLIHLKVERTLENVVCGKFKK